MKLTKTFEKFTKQQLQVLEISCTANSIMEAEELNYNSFQVNLFLNHKFIADISPVLDKTPIFTDLVDSVDWVELFMSMQEEVAEQC
jgi:hypothetical protein